MGAGREREVRARRRQSGGERRADVWECAAWRGAKEKHAYQRGCKGDVGGAPLLCGGQASEVVRLIVQEEHDAQVACCSLRVALETKGEDDLRLASERAQVQLSRVYVRGDERVALQRSQWLADSANTS